jgi:hypothetical protein
MALRQRGRQYARLGILLGAALWPSAAEPAANLEKMLADGYRLTVSQDLPGAVACYRQVARLAREQRAPWQEVEALARLVGLQPDNPTWIGELRRSLETDFPTRLSDQTRLVCPLPSTDVALTFRDPQVTSGFQGRRYGFCLQADRLPAAADPRGKGRFDRLLGGYVFDDTVRLYGTVEGAWQLCFRLFYPSPERATRGRDYTPLAQQVMTALLKFYWIAWEYLGRTPQYAPSQDPGKPVEIWLCEDGEGAGEQWQNHLYLYQIGLPRSGWEWLRELAHEYGHHVFPPVGREWASPQREPWLNGEWGERLLLSWLAANLPPDPDDQTPWEREAWSANLFAAYDRTAIRPLVERFLQEGPRSPSVTEASDAGADYALGLALSIPLLHGPALLRETLDLLQPPHAKILPRDVAALRRAYEQALTARGQAGYPLSPQGFIPASSHFHPSPAAEGKALLLGPGEVAAYWLYLPPGPGSLTLLAEGPEGFQIEAAWDELPSARLHFDRSPQAASIPLRGDGRWHILRLSPVAPDGPVKLIGIQMEGKR